MRLLLIALCGCTWITAAELRDLQDRDDDGFIAQAAGGADCDDADPEVHPNAIERCDGRDDDCDGTIDQDAEDATEWFVDADGDGFGDPTTARLGCVASGEVADDTDCDDTDPDVHPEATESCGDGVDQDCDGVDPDCP